MRLEKLAYSLIGFFMLATLSACAYPGTTVEQGGDQASLFFTSAPVGSRAFVDGEDAGPADSFNGVEQVLAVSPGRHVVEVRMAGDVIFRKDLFVGEGARLEIQVK